MCARGTNLVPAVLSVDPHWNFCFYSLGVGDQVVVEATSVLLAVRDQKV